jgi:glycosyltransferase involved in cell wall biosynthesis
LLKRMGHVVCVVSPPLRTISTVRKLVLWAKGDSRPHERALEQSHLDGTAVDKRILDCWRPANDSDVPDGDVVIATWWETAEWVAELSDSKGAKVYFIQHHEVFDYLPQARVRATYRLPFHKIVVAQWLKRVMDEQYNDKKVDVVPNSVDRTQFCAPIRGKQALPSVGFLYSKTAFKGLDTTLAALRAVRERVTDLRIISFGTDQPDSRLPSIEAKYTRLPPQHTIKNIYARCDVWVTASRSEGFNLPALEAMACRTPVVSTRTGWPEEAVKPGWNGMLVDVDDAPGLARGIQWVLAQTEEGWRSLSANAFATASFGSWDESALMFEKALEHACRRAARHEISGASNRAARA